MPGAGVLEVEEHRLSVALQPDIPGQAAVGVAPGDQGPSALGIQGGQQRVRSQGLLVFRQVDPGEEPVHQAAGEHHDGDERRGARRGGAWIDRGEGEDAGVAHGTAAEAGEGVAVADQRAGVLRDLALAVGLPDLQDGVRNGVPGAVVDGALQPDRTG